MPNSYSIDEEEHQPWKRTLLIRRYNWAECELSVVLDLKRLLELGTTLCFWQWLVEKPPLSIERSLGSALVPPNLNFDPTACTELNQDFFLGASVEI